MTAALLSISIGLSGCAPSSTVRVDPLDPPEVYPYGADLVETLEIQVFRDGPRLELVNLTPIAFDPFVLWLNERYAAIVPGLPAGGSVWIDSRTFVDEYGEAFRGGGIFAAYLPDPVVKAEIESEDGMLALQVVPPPER